jgi:hypothetical protein
MGAVHEHVQQRRLQQRIVRQIFTGGGSARNNKNARADDGADAQRRQADPAQSLAQTAFGILGVGQELVNVLRAEKLLVQISPPCKTPKLYREHWQSATDVQPENVRCASLPRGKAAQANSRWA